MPAEHVFAGPTHVYDHHYAALGTWKVLAHMLGPTERHQQFPLASNCLSLLGAKVFHFVWFAN